MSIYKSILTSNQILICKMLTTEELMDRFERGPKIIDSFIECFTKKLNRVGYTKEDKFYFIMPISKNYFWEESLLHKTRKIDKVKDLEELEIYLASIGYKNYTESSDYTEMLASNFAFVKQQKKNDYEWEIINCTKEESTGVAFTVPY